MTEIDRGIIKILEDNENPERQDLLPGIAFNLGYDSVEALISAVINQKQPVNPSRAKRRLEGHLAKFGGDKAWIEYHRK